MIGVLNNIKQYCIHSYYHEFHTFEERRIFETRETLSAPSHQKTKHN